MKHLSVRRFATPGRPRRRRDRQMAWEAVFYTALPWVVASLIALVLYEALFRVAYPWILSNG
ncbi:hypothetical protein BLA50215_07782 [Burkholderia lata]|nr:hypothetical protein BLA50215_07782 [Burkholderia lata]